MFIFCSLCSPCSGRRKNSILSNAPDHLAFSPQRFLTATTLPRRSTQVRYIYLHSFSFSIRHILLDIAETLAQHRARSHRRAASGKKPLHSIGQEATRRPTVTAAQHRARSLRPASGKLARPLQAGLNLKYRLTLNPDRGSGRIRVTGRSESWHCSASGMTRTGMTWHCSGIVMIMIMSTQSTDSEFRSTVNLPLAAGPRP